MIIPLLYNIEFLPAWNKILNKKREDMCVCVGDHRIFTFDAAIRLIEVYTVEAAPHHF